MTQQNAGVQHFPSRKRALAVAVSAAVTGVNAAHAQQVLEEIVVTATKREANLQDIPQSVTAFTTNDIQRRGFEGIDDYSKFIPGLAIGRREPGGTSIVFRGVAASGIQYGTNPSSGVYLDEQPITAAGLNPDPRLIDIERVEALRGPQGTLFGDASQSGTLRIITNKPDASAFDSWIDVSGSYVEHGEGGYDVSAMGNIPLVPDTLALRLVGFRSEEAGFIDNVLGTSQGGTFDNAEFVKDDVNSKNYTGGRAALRWTPDKNWTVDVSAIYQDLEVNGFGDVNEDVGDLEQLRFGKEQLDEDWYQIALTVEGNIGFADLLVTGSYFNRDFRYEADATDYQFAFNAYSNYAEAYYNAVNGTAYDFYFYDFGGDPQAFAVDDQHSERWTIEARLSTPADSTSRWRGLVGFFYNKLEADALFTSGNRQFAGSPAFYYLAYNPYFPSLNGLNLTGGNFAPTNNWYFGLYDQDVENIAAFGELTFDFTDNLQITAGGRWYRVERDTHTILGALQQGPEPNVATDFISTDDVGSSVKEGFVPKANITYHIDEDKLIYMTYSQGFRSGGANALRPRSVLPKTFDSDLLTNYEFGAKTTWLNGRLRLNVAAYKMIWKNIQIQVNDPTPGLFQLAIINFPEANIDGVEADFEWLPAQGWNLAGNVSYNNAEISKTATRFAQFGTPLTAEEGTKLPITPDWKASLSAEYRFQTQYFGAQPYARFDYSHVGESVNALKNLEAIVNFPSLGGSPLRTQDPYDLGDFRVGLEADKWSAAFYINNIWDERADQFISNRWQKQRISVNRPRTFGINLRRRFY